MWPLQVRIQYESAMELLMSGLHTGDRVPNFTLPNHKGQTWTLAHHLREAPAMLIFYRGDW